MSRYKQDLYHREKLEKAKAKRKRREDRKKLEKETDDPAVGHCLSTEILTKFCL